MRLNHILGLLDTSKAEDWYGLPAEPENLPVAGWNTTRWAEGVVAPFQYRDMYVWRSKVNVSLGTSPVGPLPDRRNWMDLSGFPVEEATWTHLDHRHRDLILWQVMIVWIKGERGEYALPEPAWAHGKGYEFYIREEWLRPWDQFLFDLLKRGPLDWTPARPREFYEKAGVKILDS